MQEEVEHLLQTLEQRRNWDGRQLCFYNGFWLLDSHLHGVLSAQKKFKAHENDIILATMPKSGTVWLKALIFSIVNRRRFSIENTPILTTNPHELIPFLEINIFRENENPNLDDNNILDPRIFSTHMPYQALPKSIFDDTKCRIVYICRNPLDQFISGHHFLLANLLQSNYQPLPIDQAFEMFCEGINIFGPFWDHVLGYWNASLKEPQKVLFLKYEDLKDDAVFIIKKIADFMGFPFSEDEEEKGFIDEIVKLCSFENLKSLEEEASRKKSDKSREMTKGIYRKGEVGDWVNHLTTSMAERFEKIMEEKLSGSGLTFKSLS